MAVDSSKIALPDQVLKSKSEPKLGTELKQLVSEKEQLDPTLAQLDSLESLRNRRRRKIDAALRDIFSIELPKGANPSSPPPLTLKEFFSKFFGFPSAEWSWWEKILFGTLVSPIITILNVLRTVTILPLHYLEVEFKYLSQFFSKQSRWLSWLQYGFTGLKWLARLSKWLVWSWVDPEKNWEHAGRIQNKWLRRLAKLSSVVVSGLSIAAVSIYAMTPLLIKLSSSLGLAAISAFLSHTASVATQWLMGLAKGVAYAAAVVFVMETLIKIEWKRDVVPVLTKFQNGIKKVVSVIGVAFSSLNNALVKVRKWGSSVSSSVIQRIASIFKPKTSPKVSISKLLGGIKRPTGTREELMKLPDKEPLQPSGEGKLTPVEGKKSSVEGANQGPSATTRFPRNK